MAIALIVATAANARIVYVDNSHPGAAGTSDRPFATLAEAQAGSVDGDVIYVVAGNAPYEGGITLKRGQQLIGDAYGIAGTIPAVQGPGPVIHGSIAMRGDNVVAGCTIVAEKGAAINAIAPVGPVAVRKTFIRVSQQAVGIYLQKCDEATFEEGGGLEASDAANGVSIIGGGGDIAFDHFPIRGTFAVAIAIGDRAGGCVAFRNASNVTVDDAVRFAILVRNDRGAVSFDAPVRVTARGGRGIVVEMSDSVAFGDERSRIDTTGAAALEARDAKLVANFESVSAAGVTEGVVLNRVRGGNVAIRAGTIAHASRYGIRIEQSDRVELTGMHVIDSGSESALYLRHVVHTRLRAIDIQGGGGVAASNLQDVAFDDCTIANATKTALFVEEAIGTIPFTACTITDPAGPALVIEQRFNAGRIAFDRDEISASGRPSAAPNLIDARTYGGARLALAFESLRIHDSAGAAMALAASGASHLTLDVAGAYAQSLGGAFVGATAGDAAHLAVIIRDSHVDAPVQVALADASEGCVEAPASGLRLNAGPRAQLSVAGVTPAVPTCR